MFGEYTLYRHHVDKQITKTRPVRNGKCQYELENRGVKSRSRFDLAGDLAWAGCIG